MAVTLKDIAEKTGVSPSVVSTVLSGRENGTFVSEQTRRKVIQVAEMLNYTPVRTGRPRGSRRLRRLREEHFIGVWDPDYSPATAFYVQCLQAALHQQAQQADAASEDDYGLRLLSPEDLPRLDAVGIMGMVLLSPNLLPREAAAATIPTVMIGEADRPPRDMVQVHGDNQQAGRILGEYIWDLGHRSVALLAAGAHPRVANQRYFGIKTVWQEREGDITSICPVQYDRFPTLDAREQVRKSLMEIYGPDAPAGDAPTALLCSDEHAAAIALQTLAQLGLHVPRDVSVAAFGDTPRIAEDMVPALTTVREPINQLAEIALAQLALLHDGQIPEDPAERDKALPCTLVVRNSCGAPSGPKQ